MPRMRILTANEQEAFDKPPTFDYRDRKRFFDFPKSLLTAVAIIRNANHQIGFLVSCRYFRATRRFFPLAPVMSPHQHAQEVRLPQRKTPRYPRCPAPEKDYVEQV
ncbi:MAG: DUF4158 domain-containing protein [Aestuariivita sp.]|nr:DUF4158 domain-containing protein [Aestuariivita sp.]